MKKTLAIILALVMVCSLSVVFATTETVESVTADTNKAETDVTVTATFTSAGTVYSVDVAFDPFTFDYTGTETWDPETHSYGAPYVGSWGESNTATVKVTNHSNAAIVAGVAFAALDTYKDHVSMSFDKTTDSLTAATEGSDPATAAPNTTFTGTIGGSPTIDIADDTTVGTVTVTISEPEPEEP